ncbi:peptide/nickel transport system substrate-binding protein [Frankia sp. EI5c]|uniref:ABC transporter substrate-binding protein n=1 Tax=Frankia sp. EI5c TaxID=683316 RepID=UPI0007C3A0F1|nr:ABC transporter substrate-binding protein [Frankia sp. EI5c]OAA19651.1 peptide/nickel transport system substrate-binding protein [Frankia sp. EI5c]
MFSKTRLAATAVLCGAALALGACGGGSEAADTSSSSGATGAPVAGGEGRILSLSDPSSLDPAVLGNAAPIAAVVGNALYGTLLIDDATGKIEYRMAESFESTDEGATFTLKLRSGLVFSDGTPLDAEAVKFNWDRTKDPAVRSTYLAEASLIASTEVVDSVTLKATMREPVPSFAGAVVNSSLNWIASPAALKQGQAAFDEKPIGAGPFTLQSWTRQADLRLAKNPKYWDAPKPYLDSLVVRPVSDAGQRINTVTSSGADVAIDSNPENIDKGNSADLSVNVETLNGGFFMALNTRRAPFDDVRARQAFSAAIDLEAVNLAVYNGTTTVPETLFTAESPLFENTPLHKTDRAKAQALFDELAAEGKPVTFTFSAFPSTENKSLAENIQAQLATFKNVKVEVKVVDFAEIPALRATYNFDVLVSSSFFRAPDPRLTTAFSAGSAANLSGISDQQLTDALSAGRTAATDADRKAAYAKVQQRLAELTPVVYYTRATFAAIGGANVGGLRQYGSGSLLPEEIWIKK